MEVIVAYCNFHDIDREELFPEVFFVRENETGKEALQRIWEETYNDFLAERLYDDEDDPLDDNGCWHEDYRAMITWADGDTIEFYVVNVKSFV